MRFHKAFKSERSVYTYVFTNNDRTQKVVIKPGEKGVTEVNIKMLHYMDDYEVERNIATHREEITPEKKKEIKLWTEDFIRKYEVLHGYKPCDCDLKYYVRQKFPPLWIESIEDMQRVHDDKLEELTDEHCNPEQEDFIKDRIEVLLGGLSSRDYEIYERVLLYEESKTKVAKDLGISDSRISQIAKEITKILASDEILKKFFTKTSDFTKNDRLTI